MEKVGLDLIEFREESRFVLVGVDYFTRMGFAESMTTKNSEKIIEIMKNWCIEYSPEEIVTDLGKEFNNRKFKEFCINH
ncbi:hypothetical protein COBT_003883 [Conglomerata obtusa]